MNQHTKYLATFLLALLITSTYLTDRAKALVASDQLQLKVGSYVEGAVYYSNSTVSDELLYNLRITIEKIVNATDVNKNVVFFNYSMSFSEYNPDFGIETPTTFEWTSLVFEHNRTTILPAARMYLANSTFSIEISLLEGNSIEDWTNLNNSIITFGNGTSYRYDNMSPDDFGYTEICTWMVIFAFLNFALFIYNKWIMYAISPTVNIGDKINYYNLDSDKDDYGTVIDKPSIKDTNGNQHPAIHVKYAYTGIVALDEMAEVNAYYDEKTGLLIRSIETDGTETYEFAPAVVKIKTGLLPLPFASLILGLMTAALVTVVIRRKRK